MGEELGGIAQAAAGDVPCPPCCWQEPAATNKDYQGIPEGEWGWAIKQLKCAQAMSRESLEALLLKLKDDEELQQKLKGAVNLDAASAAAREAGFDVSKYDFLENKRLIGPHWLWEWSWI